MSSNSELFTEAFRSLRIDCESNPSSQAGQNKITMILRRWLASTEHGSLTCRESRFPVGVALMEEHTPCHTNISPPRPRIARGLDEEGKRTSFTLIVGIRNPEVVVFGEETIAARSRGKTEGP